MEVHSRYVESSQKKIGLVTAMPFGAAISRRGGGGIALVAIAPL